MARPKVPLISRRKAVEEALNIIDAEGLEAFSIRRLADRLGVNGASLYHHFANKEEIVVRAAELALAKVRTPETNDETWHTWLPRNARLVSEAVRQHPGLVPVIVSRSQLGMGSQMMESSAERLLSEGVPIGAVIPLLDALEIFAIGAAIHETRAGDDDERGRLDPDSLLGRAVDCRSLSFEEMYDVVSRAIVESVAAAAEAKTPPAKARRTTKPVTPVRKAVKRAPAKSAPVKSAPVKSGPVKRVPAKSGPVKSGPVKVVAAKGAPRSA
jgi:AcrR family transcriptional regulator